MRENNRLDVAALEVESFATAPAPPKPDNAATCLLTQCGKIQCCN